MTLHTVGQATIAEWCSVTTAAVAMWIIRYNDWPEPDVEVTNRDGKVIRGWLPERRAEWEAYGKPEPPRGKHQVRRPRHPERLPDGTLRFAPDGTDRLTVTTFDHSANREHNIGRH